MAAGNPDARIGSVLEGRYRIIERIARGGMGVVYRAERIPVGRPVAVKFLHAMFADEPDARARFERETRALARLAHSHCVSIIDFGVSDSPYLVMEHVAGVTLRDLLDEGALPLEEALALGRQLLAGLAHAHAQGIVHRDVKPANIMVTDEIGTGRHVRILDFGLARLRDTTSSTQLTQAQIAVGTPSYMAPEQTLGGAIDARTDVYAAGVVLFEMLTGQRPFAADDTATLLELHRSAPPPRLATVDPLTAWPAELDLALARALAKAPGERWPSAVEFAAALDVIARGVRASTAPPPGLDLAVRRPRRARTALLALALAGGAAAFALVELRPRSRPGASTATSATSGAQAAGVAGPRAIGIAAAPGASADDLPASPITDTPALAADDLDAGADERAGAAVDPAGLDANAGADLAAVIADPTATAGTPGSEGAGALDPGAPGGEAAAGVAPDLDDIELTTNAPVPSADPESEPAQTQADDPADEPGPVDAGVAASAAPPVTPARTVKEALAQIKRGEHDAALSGLRAQWRQHSKSAVIPYLLGNLYHDRRWWTVSMEHYQAAIKRDRAYRGNATLNRNVIDALSSAKTRGKASWFLRTIIGAPARRYLKTAARSHKSASVRRAAAYVLKKI